MSDTHDHPTKEVLGKDLDHTMVLVGESGGLSAIYDAKGIDLIDVTTEHGVLNLDPDRAYTVYDAEGSA